MIKYLSITVMMLANHLHAETFPEMGIPVGYYTYKGLCAETFDASGGLGQMSFLFDGQNLNSANSNCRIRSVDFISAGYLNSTTTCTNNKTGSQTNEVYTLLPDQTGRPRIKLTATYVNGRLTSEGNPDWFHLCKALGPSS
jgi:hypothetical protein